MGGCKNSGFYRFLNQENIMKKWVWIVIVVLLVVFAILVFLLGSAYIVPKFNY